MTERKPRKAKPVTAAAIDFEPAVGPGLDLPTTVDEALARYAMAYTTPTTIWDRELRIALRPGDLRHVLDRDLYKSFINHPAKLVIRPDDVVFDPTETCAPHCVNLFRGMPLQPKRGDCSLILELLDHLMSASSKYPEEVRANTDWVLRWIAYPLQNPGAKMSTAVVLHGPQGTGKSMFWEIVLRIYGEYGKTGGQTQLESKYNDWVSRALFMLFEEVAAQSELLHKKNEIKALVTSEYLLIESKFQPVRKERNCCNFVFLSNEARPLALEADDRRYAVFWTAAKRTDGLYAKVAHSLKYGAVEAFYHHLLTLDLSGFNEHTPPPMTSAKMDLVELGLKPAERFARDWLAHGLELPLWACSTSQLYKGFQRWARMQGERTIVNQNVFTSTVAKFSRDALSRLKCVPSRGTDGTPITLWMPEGTGPLPGVSNYTFAQEAVSAFDVPLSRFGAGSVEL